MRSALRVFLEPLRVAKLPVSSSPHGSPASLQQLAILEAEIYPTKPVNLEQISAYTNALPDLQAAWRPAYAARTVNPAAIGLYRLPQGAQLSGSSGGHVLSGGHLLAEQITPNEPVDFAAVLNCFPAFPKPINVRAETVLIARYGDSTWGHWLVELLPKIAACERYAPGRFTYAITTECLDQLGQASLRLREAIAFCGVPDRRLLRIRNDVVYSFRKLYALSPVFTEFILHPDVTDLMIDLARQRNAGVSAGPGRVALLRREGARRLHNSDEVEALLLSHGFTLVDIAQQSFEQQVQTFSSATTIFSVLGSGLSGLIFSPPGVRVVVAAPELWGDRFFYNIAQTKPGARWAEVRGPVVDEDPALYRSSSFEAPLDVLALALEAIDQPFEPVAWS